MNTTRLTLPVIALAVASACAPVRIPPQWRGAASIAVTCDDILWHHTYRAESRLATIERCVTAVGIVRDTHRAGDGDLIIELETDPRLVNAANVNGWLKVEAVCQTRGDKRKHRNACRDYTGPRFTPPPLGATVRVTGRYVADRRHGGHMEIHPLSRLEVLR